MSIRDSITAVLAPAFVLAACAGMPSGGSGADGKLMRTSNVHCKASQSVCGVDVYYDDPHDSDLDCGSYCYAVVQQFVVVDKPARKADVQYVEWNVHGAHAFFAPDGIAFKDSNAPFKDCGPGKVGGNGSDKKFYHCTNDHPGTAPWKYTVTLKLDDDFGAIQPTDPWVVNK
jgi:hypothetical protein